MYLYSLFWALNNWQQQVSFINQNFCKKETSFIAWMSIVGYYTNRIENKWMPRARRETIYLPALPWRGKQR
jgi:hypothetical protein